MLVTGKPVEMGGSLGRREATHYRRVRTIAYKQVAYLDVTYAEYRARCSCRKTFRTNPPDVEPKALYDNKVRAFDKLTGKLLWEDTMPTSSIATPSTYAVNGKQYFAVSSGGGKNPKLKVGGGIIAYALP